jgi:AraC-like DNA-binding protein
MKIKSTDKLSDKYLEINSVGTQLIHGEKVGSLQENGRPDYHILYVSEGVCEIIENSNLIKAKEGDIIYYPPKTRQEYYFSEDTKSISYYLHFSGTECERLLSEIGLMEGRIYSIGKSKELEEAFINLIAEYNSGIKFSELLSSSALLRLLGLIGIHIAYEKSKADLSSVDKIKEVRIQMYREIPTARKIDDYAKMCNLSESRFSHLFKEHSGLSPLEYIQSLRLKKSRELLENTDMSVAKIAEAVGIADQNYFSRFFKAKMGVSPRRYREKC